MGFKRIPLDQIMPDPEQPRKHFDAAALRELAQSIRERGLIQAITVRPNKDRGPDSPPYIITSGERRWRAHCILKDEGRLPPGNDGTILAQVRLQSREDKMIDAIVENLARADVSPMEEANAFAQALEMPGWTKERLAKSLGVVPFKIEWRLSLLKLDPDLQKMVGRGELQPQYGMEIAKVPQHQQRELLARLNRGCIKSWNEMRSAVAAIIEAESQDTFLDEDLAPRVTPEQMTVVTRMEDKIERLCRLVSAGWSEGECTVVKQVQPDRARLMAEKIGSTIKALKIMERDLRNAATQTELKVSVARSKRGAVSLPA